MLYLELAGYYDLIYAFKRYEKEAIKIKKIIDKYKKSDEKELLEVACGTGNHLKYFKNYFNCTGIDKNKGILSIAKKKLKDVKFKQADMVSFTLGKKFDIITCLFSSIGYVKTYKNLRKTINNCYRHLKKGGIVIIEPWFTRKEYKKGAPHMNVYNDKDIKIARLSVSKVKNNISRLDMHYLIAKRNKEVMHFVDRHELGMFEIDKTLKLMKETGFNSKFIKKGLMKGRGLYLGVK